MMRLSTAGRYALRAMVDLAQHDGSGPVLRREIAGRQEVSEQYLAQLFAKLRRAELVESIRGPGGGYTLTRPATTISAGDVLRAVEETLDLVHCVEKEHAPTCHRAEGCSTRWLWARLGETIVQVLDGVTLAELCIRSDIPVGAEGQI